MAIRKVVRVGKQNGTLDTNIYNCQYVLKRDHGVGRGGFFNSSETLLKYDLHIHSDHYNHRDPGPLWYLFFFTVEKII